MHNCDKRYVLNKIIEDRLEVYGKWYIKNWPENYIPPYAPSSYTVLINRINNQKFTYKGKEFNTNSRIESSGRIYTNLIGADDQVICYQSLKEIERKSVKFQDAELAMFDVSASQLRVALALRGVTLPFEDSPWDKIVIDVAHAEINHLNYLQKRNLIKRVALLSVKGIKNIDIKKIWQDETGVTPKVNLKGVKKNIEESLFSAYPELLEEPITPNKTPDGYTISHLKGLQTIPIKCRPLNIDTKYHIPTYENPRFNNILEALEGWILRKAIKGLPSEAPILTCHDEISTLSIHINTIKALWEDALSNISKLSNHNFIRI